MFGSMREAGLCPMWLAYSSMIAASIQRTVILAKSTEMFGSMKKDDYARCGNAQFDDCCIQS
jgi:hypothetical protein